jgi:uncharacterized membrane protein (UPF0127 family)
MRCVSVLLSLLMLCQSSQAGTAVPTSLPQTTLVIDSGHGPATFKVEVAADDASQRRGLMHRTKLAADAGMLFDLHRPEMIALWMKDTLLPLDMIFIREDGTISSIAPNAQPLSETSIPSAEPVRAVLEINAGRAAALDIEPGQKVRGAIFGNTVPGRK